MDSSLQSAGLSSGLLLAVGALIVAQLALQVTALVQLAKAPAERVRIGGRKWVWALIIIFGEMLGALIWFVAGREPKSVDVVAPSSSASAAVSALYPEGKQPQGVPSDDPELGADGTAAGELP